MPTLDELYEKCITGEATALQRQEFIRLISLPENEERAIALFSHAFARVEPLEKLPEASATAMIEAILFAGKHMEQKNIAPVRLLNLTWFKVAAAVILFLSVGSYFFFHSQEQKPVLTQTSTPAKGQDILPGTNRATLVLGDESIIALDTASNGLVTTQGGSQIIKTADGEIIYAGGKKGPSHVYYQKLITPRGGTYQVTLADGTSAWLNAESSIRFPSVFTEGTRTVEITGEVYFQVRADRSRPFIVKTRQDEIAVLGTRFNVNAYSNQPIKTTLVDGVVKINQDILQPGQAYVNGMVTATDIAQDIAWTKGFFNFNNLELNIAMQQIARWYDVNIIYEGTIPKMRFGGKMQRDLSLQQMLKALGAMGVRFSLDGRNLTVKP